MRKLKLLNFFLVFISAVTINNLSAQTASDSAVIVRISNGIRYYYGNLKNNAVTNGDTLQSVFTLMSPKDSLLLRSSTEGGIFQGAFTANAAGSFVKGGFH